MLTSRNLSMNITVYCGSNPGDKECFKQAAHRLGNWIGARGDTLVYGGSSVGLMGVLSKSVLESGGNVIGVEPNFFIEAGVAQHELTELIVVKTMNERKAKMIELGDVFVALPGGVGTLEEISEIMVRVRLNLTPAPCLFLNVDGFYEPLKALIQEMVDRGFMPGFAWDDYLFPTSVDELTSLIQALPEQRCASTEDEWDEPVWVSSEEAFYFG